MEHISRNDGEKVALVDLDGTVADYEGALMEDLRRLRSPDEHLCAHDEQQETDQ